MARQRPYDPASVTTEERAKLELGRIGAKYRTRACRKRKELDNVTFYDEDGDMGGEAERRKAAIRQINLEHKADALLEKAGFVLAWKDGNPRAC
jgi:hypothetical protein